MIDPYQFAAATTIIALVVGGISGVLASGAGKWRQKCAALEAENRELAWFKARVLRGLRRSTDARKAKAVADRRARQAKVIIRHAGETV